MIARTEDGKKVILKDDGTWEEIKEVVNEDISYDVKKVKWGMNIQNVKDSEDIELSESDSILVGDIVLSGLKALLAYDFINNKELYSVRYIFVNEHSDDGDFIYDYERIKKGLIQKYGSDFEDHRIFTDDLYEDIPSERGMALGRGKLSFFSIWKTEKTEIELSLYGDNHEIKFNLSYSGLVYKELLEKKSEESFLDDL